MFVHNYPVVIMATTNNIQASDGNKIQKSGGLVVCMWLTVASVR